jgi:hypothetical protein
LEQKYYFLEIQKGVLCYFSKKSKKKYGFSPSEGKIICEGNASAKKRFQGSMQVRA